MADLGQSGATPDLRPFPMQDGPPIPWYVAEAIHKHLYRCHQDLETVARRGGFGWTEVAYMAHNRQWGTTQDERDRCRLQIAAAARSQAEAQPVTSASVEPRPTADADHESLRRSPSRGQSDT